MMLKLSIVAFLSIGSTIVVDAQRKCGLATSITCSNSTHAKSCRFDQITATGLDCLRPVTIEATVCNSYNSFHAVEILNPESAIELTGNGFTEADRTTHGLTGPSTSLDIGQCMTKKFEPININICQKRYNVKVNARAQTTVENNCRAYQFNRFSNKRECKVTTRADCFIDTTNEKCADVFYSRSTCGVKRLRFELEYCNNNRWPDASIRPLSGRTKFTLGRPIDPGHVIFDPKLDLPADLGNNCKTVTEYRDVNTCRSFAPHANSLLNARILGDDGRPDTINNQHCFSNTYLPGHSWGMPYPSEEPTTTPTFGPTASPSTSAPTDSPAGDPTDSPTDSPTGAPTKSPTGGDCSGKGKGSKGCSKGKGSSDYGTGNRRKRIRNRRNL